MGHRGFRKTYSDFIYKITYNIGVSYSSGPQQSKFDVLDDL